MTTRSTPLLPRRQPAPCVVTPTAVVCREGAAIVRHGLDHAAPSSVAVPEATVAIGGGPGGPVVVAQDLDKATARMLRIAGATPVEVKAEYAASFTHAAFAYAPSAERLWVASKTGLDTFKVGTLVEIAGTVTWNGDQIATVTGLFDSVIYGEGGGLMRVGPEDQRTAYTSAIPTPIHLAAGGDRDHVWASAADVVGLLALAGGAATVVHKVELPGVYHLASVDGDAAVLSVAMKGGAWASLTLTLVGQDGKVRWAKPLPLPSRGEASVAGGSGHVAVVLDGALHVFKAADGAAVGP